MWSTSKTPSGALAAPNSLSLSIRIGSSHRSRSKAIGTRLLSNQIRMNRTGTTTTLPWRKCTSSMGTIRTCMSTRSRRFGTSLSNSRGCQRCSSTYSSSAWVLGRLIPTSLEARFQVSVKFVTPPARKEHVSATLGSAAFRCF